MILQRWVSRSSVAPVSRSEPRTSVQFSKGKLVVTMTLERSYADEALIVLRHLDSSTTTTGVSMAPLSCRRISIRVLPIRHSRAVDSDGEGSGATILPA